MLQPYWADLHVHTVLSPCAEVEMIPPLICRQARRLGLALLAVTDHNACHNAEAMIEAAAEAGIHVFPGMELQSREEVHLLCLFDTVGQCREWQQVVFDKLPRLVNREQIWGAQFIVDATGEWQGSEGRLLAVSADLGLEEVVRQVEAGQGIVIPAHVDRPSFSLLANLGWVPEDLAVPALEVTPRFVPEEGLRQWPQLASRTLIVGGDAHRLQELQRRTRFWIEAPRIEEIRLALRGQGGRAVAVDWPEA
jgi:3',5'-nucleoside bisphosphate phosphatase